MSKYKFVKPKKQFKFSDPFSIKSGRFKNGKLTTVNRTGWAEDVYIDDNREKEVVGNNFNMGKIPVLIIFTIFFSSLLIGKIAWMQIIKGDDYYLAAEDNRLFEDAIEPKRGVIYDREMRPLVRNKANFMLYLIPANLPEDTDEQNRIFDKISHIMDGFNLDSVKQSLSEIDPKSLEMYQPLFVNDRIPYEQAMQLYIEVQEWTGVSLTNRTNRDYLIYYLKKNEEMNEEEKNIYHSLSHILGYTGKINNEELKQFGIKEYSALDYIGKMGVEYFWENELKGQKGNRQVEKDAFGKVKKIIGEVDAVDGNNLVLSLDVMMQIKLEEVMMKQLEKLESKRAAAIILNPQNGEVLAMVSLPAYDNNVFARGISQNEYQELINHPDNPLFNRVVSGEYPSGSTIKPMMAVAALEEGIVTEHTTFLSTGGIQIGQWYFPDWRAGGHGRVNVYSAIANSVNTYFYYIGGGYDDFRGLGVDKIVHYGELFGFGTQTGIDLAGEASGFLPTREWKESFKKERWYIGDTYHLSIGQGDLLATPLQVVAYTASIANGGSLYRPHFINRILTSQDKPYKESEIVPVREDFIDPYNIEVVRKAMRQTVTKGSAKLLNELETEIAGKTGTAQWSSKKETHAWFTGFAPYDKPELAFTILVEEGGEGSETAVPIAKEFLSWYFEEYKK